MNYYANAVMQNRNYRNTNHDADRVAGFDRAIILQTSWVRHKPYNRGGRTIKLNEGTTVALRQNSGPWWQIAYRHPITDKIEDGWIYETLVEKIGWIIATTDPRDISILEN